MRPVEVLVLAHKEQRLGPKIFLVVLRDATNNVFGFPDVRAIRLIAGVITTEQKVDPLRAGGRTGRPTLSAFSAGCGMLSPSS